jgi:NAD+ synthase (glutamine-hydrolysing)
LQHKTLLPTYDVFDEYRYFEPSKKHTTVEFKGKRIALTICEDLWNVGNENPLYTQVPMDIMMTGETRSHDQCLGIPFRL